MRSRADDIQAVRAVETLNGVDLGGRKILVREDREDKDVKNYNRCVHWCLQVLLRLPEGVYFR